MDNEATDLVCTTTCSEYFDEVIGHIEDIVMSDEFQKMHKDFLESNYASFGDTEEHSIENYISFQNYGRIFEDYLFGELKIRMPDFDMTRFEREISENDATDDHFKNCEIHELLFSFTNFEKFKELLLDYRHEKEGNLQHLLVSDVLITKAYPVDDGIKDSPMKTLATD